MGWEAHEEVQKFTLLSAFSQKDPAMAFFLCRLLPFLVSFLPKQAGFIKMAGEPKFYIKLLIFR